MAFNGASWSYIASPSGPSAIKPSFAVSANGKIYIAYASGAYPILMRYENSEFTGTTQMATSSTNNPILAISTDGIPYVAYADASDGSNKATVTIYSNDPEGTSTYQ